MNNINYNLEMEKIIEKNKKEGIKPKLLMQVCCAPCSSTVIDRLKDDFDIDIFYYNPMIYPKDELNKRIDQVYILSKEVDFGGEIIIPPNDISDFNDIAKNRKDDKEGGDACFSCYELRLEESAKYAKENGYDYFTTTLSISPYKNSKRLNEIGKRLSEKYDIDYLYSDFKKKNGYQMSIELSKKYDLYRQSYCGCIFSYNEMMEYQANKDTKNIGE